MKFYAVKSGRSPGIYKTWKECQQQTTGYSGALFRSFPDEQSARAWLDETVPSGDRQDSEKQNEDVASRLKELDETEAVAFVDGSYNAKTKTAGYGAVLFCGKQKPRGFRKAFTHPELARMRNFAGEMLGALRVIEFAAGNGITRLDLYFDYAGIRNLADGTWTPGNELSTEYARRVQACRKQVDVRFIKVRAHTGMKGNELADRYAKEAVGL